MLAYCYKTVAPFFRITPGIALRAEEGKGVVEIEDIRQGGFSWRLNLLSLLHGG